MFFITNNISCRHQSSPLSTSVLNNNLATSATAGNDKDILPSQTRSESHKQPPPSSPQGMTTLNCSFLKTADFPICDDRSEIEPDDDGTISNNDDISPAAGVPCTPPGIPIQNRNQQTRREAENSKKVESPFVPSLPLHAQPHPHVKPSHDQKQKKRRRKRKRNPSETAGTLPMSSNEDLSVSSGSRGTGAVRHLKSSGGPLFTLLAPSPAPSASSCTSASATSYGYTSTASSSTTTTASKRRK